MILDQIKVTADREVKRQLAIRAFELVQQAEQLLGDEEQRLGVDLEDKARRGSRLPLVRHLKSQRTAAHILY